MKILKPLLVLIAVLCPFALKFGWEHHQAILSKADHDRVRGVERVIREKLEAYAERNGVLPESLSALSFTNSPAELDMLSEVNKFRYRRNDQGGYMIGYHSETVDFSSSYVVDH